MHDTLEDQHYLQCSFLTRVPAGTLRAKVDLQIQIVPADGTNAAFNWREYGKPRWRLSNENLHRFAGGRKGRRLLVAPWRKPRPATVTSTREREQNIAETVRVVGDAVCAVASMPLPIGGARPLLACSVCSGEVPAKRCRRLPITGAPRGGSPGGDSASD
jgi:hypothetical protein